MRVTSTTTGLDSLIQRVNSHDATINRQISQLMNNTGENVERYAKQNHRFKSDSSSLERSVTTDYKRPNDNTHMIMFYLNDTFTTTTGGKSYGVFIHEGTYQGYSRSPIAPLYSTTQSKSGSGWKADPFLYNAIKVEWIDKFNDQLRRLAIANGKQFEQRRSA